jgi:hypothetical protein
MTHDPSYPDPFHPFIGGHHGFLAKAAQALRIVSLSSLCSFVEFMLLYVEKTIVMSDAWYAFWAEIGQRLSGR